MGDSARTTAALFSDGAEQYSVRLQAFEGPLDLLLHLIKQNQLEITDIPIADITRQYLEYLALMKELNLDIAGEFLVMAATLLQIKSRLLLPEPVLPDEGQEEEVEDPRAELVRRLLEYQRYKEAAQTLDRLPQLGREVYRRETLADELPEPEQTLVAGEVGLFELLEALGQVLARTPRAAFHEVGAEPVSLAERIAEILERLGDGKPLAFEDLLQQPLSRDDVIVTFLAVLELCRLKTVRLTQAERFGPIWLSLRVTASLDAEEDHADDTP